jgi:hypothetical protein
MKLEQNFQVRKYAPKFGCGPIRSRLIESCGDTLALSKIETPQEEFNRLFNALSQETQQYIRNARNPIRALFNFFHG